MAGDRQPVAPIGVEALTFWIREFAHRVGAQKDLLTELDSAIGDADHGTNMDRGLTAVVAVLDAGPPAGPVAGPAAGPLAGAPPAGAPLAGAPTAAASTPGALLKAVGMTLVSTVGGASGPLYGTLFLRMAAAAGADERLDGEGFARALRAGLGGVLARGRAAPGDKTMVDALTPACDALDAALGAGTPPSQALAAASRAADAGRDATTPMLARKGRASYLGERSIGHQDPGATSAALLIGAAAATLGQT